MKKSCCSLLVLVISNFIFVMSCTSIAKETESSRTSDDFNLQVLELVDRTTNACKNCPNIILGIKSPKLGIDFQIARSGDQTLKDPGRIPFRIASITKIFTAILIYRLVDQKKISLDDRISKYLSPSLIRGLHIYGGVDRTNEITIRQALFHTSGLGNQFHREDCPEFFDEYSTQIKKLWTPSQVLKKLKGKLKSHFLPGSDYYYSDGGYLLLGLLAEKVFKRDLAEIYRSIISEKIGLDNTGMEFDGLKKRKVSPIYYDNIDTSSWTSISSDWAGGGLVSTIDDLDTFIRSIFAGEKLILDASRNDMTKWRKVADSTFYAGGIGSKLTSIGRMIGHSGATSAFVHFQPELDLTIVGTFNQYQFDRSQFEEELIALIAAHLRKTNTRVW